MTRPFAPTALLFGNFVIGTAILAPGGMLAELSSGLAVSIRDAGLLITFGAVVLCICSPLSAWLTGSFDRRNLLGGILAFLALANVASAFAPNYAALMVLRLVMMAVAAPFTPQAAGAVALIMPVEKRGSTIAFIFLGWSLAAAAGLPLATLVASHFGWRAAYTGIGLLSLASFALVMWRIPGRLIGAQIDLKTWIALGRDPLVALLLSVTGLLMAGQFVVFTFMAPLLRRLANANPEAVALVFALYGVFGFIGNVVATRLVDSWGGYRTSLLFSGLVLAGVSIWAFGTGAFAVMAAGVSVWGLCFASSNSMQQVRLIEAAPPFAGASVSLNTSVLYIGQAVGSAIGGMLYARELLDAVGYVAAAFVAVALVVILVTGRVSPVQA